MLLQVHHDGMGTSYQVQADYSGQSVFCFSKIHKAYKLVLLLKLLDPVHCLG